MSEPHSAIRLELRVLGERVSVTAPRPPERVRLDEVLPLLREIDERAIELAVRRVEADGERVSCCRGCSTCCRAQPVPVTPPEAYALLRLVESLPEPRQSEIRRRFADHVDRLRESGLIDDWLQRDPDLTREQAREVARRYFDLGLVCPFLEDDACSIYPDRPLVCRQYLVTSPAALCQNPFDNPVRPIPLPLGAAGAVLQASEQLSGTPHYTIPLVLALEYAQAHREELELTYGSEDLFRRCVAALARPQSPDTIHPPRRN